MPLQVTSSQFLMLLSILIATYNETSIDSFNGFFEFFLVQTSSDQVTEWPTFAMRAAPTFRILQDSWSMDHTIHIGKLSQIQILPTLPLI